MVFLDNEDSNSPQRRGMNNGGPGAFMPNDDIEYDEYRQHFSQQVDPFYDQDPYMMTGQYSQDAQFQPPQIGQSYLPGPDFNDMNIPPIHSQQIDQKIMENIQKYISQYMVPQQQQQQNIMAPQNQAQNFPPQQNFYQSQQQPSQFEQQMQMQSYEQINKQQLMNNANLNASIRNEQYQSKTSSNQLIPDSSPSIRSEELAILKLTIDKLNNKLDSMQSFTEKLQVTIDQKDRELSKIKSINSLRGFRSDYTRPGDSGKAKKVKREKGTQTVINLVDNKQEYETFSYLYDKDQDLMRSEKDALLKYMRKEVVQNQEFLERIQDLEDENEQLKDELSNTQRHLQRSQLFVRQLQEGKEEEKVETDDRQVSCDILTLDDFQGNKLQIQQLTENLYQEQALVKQLEKDLQSKEQELIALQDSTSQELYNEIVQLKSQLNSAFSDIDSYKATIQQIEEQNQQLQSEIEALKKEAIKQDKSAQENIQSLKKQNQLSLEKAQDDKTKFTNTLKDKEHQIWELKQKIEEQSQFIQQLENQMIKKQKKKVQECMNCIKKDMEIQGLTTNVDKLKTDLQIFQIESEKSNKQKDQQVKDSQSLIEQLTKQIQQNVVRLIKSSPDGGVDPTIKQTIEKLEQENDSKSQLIEQMKQQMAKQAQQFMQAMMQQEATNKNQQKKQ